AWAGAVQMSAFDPKRTSPDPNPGPSRVLLRVAVASSSLGISDATTRTNLDPAAPDQDAQIIE
ncbi:MAG: hypothetical protein WCC54_29670, partial [Pseudolabrys sp.]